MTAENPYAGQGPVLLDIGGDIGALLVTMPPELVGAEVAIRPIDGEAVLTGDEKQGTCAHDADIIGDRARRRGENDAEVLEFAFRHLSLLRAIEISRRGRPSACVLVRLCLVFADRLTARKPAASPSNLDTR